MYVCNTQQRIKFVKICKSDLWNKCVYAIFISLYDSDGDKSMFAQ